MSTKVEVLNPNEKESDKFLDHFALYFRLIGIPVDLRGIKSKFLYFWTVFFGIAVFCFNFAINFMALSFLRKPTSTGHWNQLLNEVNFAFAFVMGHAGLLAFTAPNWTNLAHVFHEIQQIGLFQPADYKKFNQICRIGLIILAVWGFNSLTISLVFSFDLISYELMKLPIKITFAIYIGNGVFMFILLGWITLVMLRIMSKQVDHQKMCNNQVIMDTLLDQWQRTYHLIGSLLNQINKCFGFIVLATLIFIFIWMINGSFLLLVEFRENGLNSPALFLSFILFVTLICFTFVIVVPDKVKQEASLFAHQLRSLKFVDPALNQKVFKLIMEVSLYPPTISLMGLIHIDLRLIPTLLGTTLTYLIILFQFRSSEYGATQP